MRAVFPETKQVISVLIYGLIATVRDIGTPKGKRLKVH